MKRIDQKTNDDFNDFIPTKKTVKRLIEAAEKDDLKKWDGFDFDAFLDPSLVRRAKKA